eukprot:TRINITY_DN17496_c0_g1_i1.p2 TRINITY_DN17496_c0_g1~~TRINITY_DN17496_c0_g1_i1.p2  ORF type:complete len:334 (+),score=97.07 TRINITY_DN17496_c0_g1_i1:37-1038(+)
MPLADGGWAWRRGRWIWKPSGAGSPPISPPPLTSVRAVATVLCRSGELQRVAAHASAAGLSVESGGRTVLHVPALGLHRVAVLRDLVCVEQRTGEVVFVRIKGPRRRGDFAARLASAARTAGCSSETPRSPPGIRPKGRPPVQLRRPQPPTPPPSPAAPSARARRPRKLRRRRLEVLYGDTPPTGPAYVPDSPPKMPLLHAAAVIRRVTRVDPAPPTDDEDSSQQGGCDWTVTQCDALPPPPLPVRQQSTRHSLPPKPDDEGARRLASASALAAVAELVENEVECLDDSRHELRCSQKRPPPLALGLHSELSSPASAQDRKAKRVSWSPRKAW